MPSLDLTILRGLEFEDRGKEPACCGDRKPSKPMLYFGLRSNLSIWRTAGASITQVGTNEDGSGPKVSGCNWNKNCPSIRISDPDQDQLVFYVVDSAQHYPPEPDQQLEAWPKRQDPKCPLWSPPAAAVYGKYAMSVNVFEQKADREQRIILKNLAGTGDTKYVIYIKGRWGIENWQREEQMKLKAHQQNAGPGEQNMGGGAARHTVERTDNFAQPGPPSAPPQQYPPQPPVPQYPPQQPQYPPQQPQYAAQPYGGTPQGGDGPV